MTKQDPGNGVLRGGPPGGCQIDLSKYNARAGTSILGKQVTGCVSRHKNEAS